MWNPNVAIFHIFGIIFYRLKKQTSLICNTQKCSTSKKKPQKLENISLSNVLILYKCILYIQTALRWIHNLYTNCIIFIIFIAHNNIHTTKLCISIVHKIVYYLCVICHKMYKFLLIRTFENKKETNCNWFSFLKNILIAAF